MNATERGISDAHVDRAHWAGKIKSFEKTLNNDEKFVRYSYAELKEAKEYLNRMQEQFDEKCVIFGGVDAASGTTAEDDEIEIRCAEMKSKISKRMAEIALTTKNSPTIKTATKPPVLRQVTNDIASVNVLTTGTSQISNDNVSNETVIDQQFTFGHFNGGLSVWHSFAKRFKQEVATNSSINASRKFELLANACQEEAKVLVHMNDGNFHNAWQQLEETFGEAYAQFGFCLSKMLETRDLDAVSLDGLRYIQKRGDMCVGLLSQHNQQNQFDTIMVILLAKKLDAETGRVWDRHRLSLASKWATSDVRQEGRMAHHFLPTWQDFNIFLKNEIKILEIQALRRNAKALASSSAVKRNFTTMQSGVAPTPSQTSDFSQVDHSKEPSIAQGPSRKITSARALREQKEKAPNKLQCTLCECIHMPYHCDIFREMSFDEKWSFVGLTRLCIRCLHPNHGHTPCKVRTANNACKFCRDIHHVLDYHNGQLCPTKFGYNPFPTNERAPAPIPLVTSPTRYHPEDGWGRQ